MIRGMEAAKGLFPVHHTKHTGVVNGQIQVTQKTRLGHPNQYHKKLD